MKATVLSLISLFVLTLTPAYGFDFQWKNEQSLRYDISIDNEDWYITRLWGETCHYFPAINKELKISPFVETRYHFHSHKLCRTEMGIEVGTDLFDGVYWGESLQYATLHPGRDTFELESILLLTFPFRIRNHELKFYILEEHTYVFVFGEGKRNEVAIGISWEIKENIKALFGWRHTDRIHYYDTDHIELSVISKF